MLEKNGKADSKKKKDVNTLLMKSIPQSILYTSKKVPAVTEVETKLGGLIPGSLSAWKMLLQMSHSPHKKSCSLSFNDSSVDIHELLPF